MLPLGKSYIIRSKLNAEDKFDVDSVFHKFKLYKLNHRVKEEGAIILQYKDLQLISAIDIYKFRSYPDYEFWVFSQKSKRFFIYDSNKNEITLSP